MARSLEGKKVAALVARGFEQVELLQPMEALEMAGAMVDIVSPETGGRVRGWNKTDWGEEVDVDVTLADASSENYDALLLPGGVMNPDILRTIPQAVQFTREFFDAGKPIASICHGPWTLVEADVVRGLRVTSWPSLETDLENAGAEWTDAQVVVDRGIVTSRKPDDIPAFAEKMIEEIAEGQHGNPGHRAKARGAGASGR
jgi:protease I